MKCPQCKAWAIVLETRSKPNNETYRRYQCANEHKFSTKETPAEWENYRKSDLPDKIRNLLRNIPNGLTCYQIAKVIGITHGDVRKKLARMNDAYIVDWVNPPRHTALWSVSESVRDKPSNARRPPKAAETLRQLSYRTS
jgi:transposase-like protein